MQVMKAVAKREEPESKREKEMVAHVGTPNDSGAGGASKSGQQERKEAKKKTRGDSKLTDWYGMIGSTPERLAVDWIDLIT